MSIPNGRFMVFWLSKLFDNPKDRAAARSVLSNAYRGCASWPIDRQLLVCRRIAIGIVNRLVGETSTLPKRLVRKCAGAKTLDDALLAAQEMRDYELSLRVAHGLAFNAAGFAKRGDVSSAIDEAHNAVAEFCDSKRYQRSKRRVLWLACSIWIDAAT